jgi:hypothetical protein
MRISFGLKAGEHTRYTEAVTVTPGLALALRDLINTYVPTPAPTPPSVTAEPKRVEKSVDLARLRPRTGDRSTPH